MSRAGTEFDILIVGAGISGIGMAAHLRMHCPGRDFTLIEQRKNIGGTWDLFRYPGVRSDSDMHTLGFVFEPWRHEKSIADGDAILAYLNKIADEREITPHIQFETKVISADWRGADGRWHIILQDSTGVQRTVTAKFLYMGSGYYDYDQPYDPGFDTRAFAGQIFHPQFWPQDLDYSGKRVVIIGSGATAVTMLPAMTDRAAHVTMLQRTPTWMFARDAKDAIANTLRKILPEEWAYKITRFKNIKLQDISFKIARNKPDKVAKNLHKRIRKIMGKDVDLAPFTPPYDPWDQRLCLVPDADFFHALKAGKAAIVTGHIAKFVEDGIMLKNGDFIPADIIVTATGLRLELGGKVDIRQEGEKVEFTERYFYKGCMFSNLPNFAIVFGYLNASWTLRADINSEYICRVLNVLETDGMDIAVPHLPDDHDLVEDDLFDFSSGYIQRGKASMPKSAAQYPWRLNQEYVFDRKVMREGPVKDGILKFAKAGNAVRADKAA